MFINILPYINNFLNKSELYTLNNTSILIRNKLKLKYYDPYRLTFSIMNKCTLCNNICQDVKEICISLVYINGWITCNDCINDCNYSFYRYLLSNRIIHNNFIDNLSNIKNKNYKLKFFRNSINKVQFNNELYILDNQVIVYQKKNNYISLLLKWNDTVLNDTFYRQVSLRNLIHHNRDIFGYNCEDFIFKFNNNVDIYTKNILNNLFKKEYEIVNQIYYLKLVLLKKEIFIDTDSFNNIINYLLIFF